MIRDTPTAFAESLEEALSYDEAEWRMRGRRGFVATGHTVPYNLDSSKNEIEMVKKL